MNFVTAKRPASVSFLLVGVLGLATVAAASTTSINSASPFGELQMFDTSGSATRQAVPEALPTLTPGGAINLRRASDGGEGDCVYQLQSTVGATGAPHVANTLICSE